ncbi:MAG: DUF6913 domain-containing protein [Candidatus Cryptobacteroides sp.]
MGFIRKYLRRRRLQRDASTVPTGFVPLSGISTADVVIDVEEAGFDQLKEDILAWGRSNDVKVNTLFLDFRKIGKDVPLMTSIQDTILKKELNWYGVPPQEKASLLAGDGTDLFISMIDNGDFPIEYLSKCSKARFKIGRRRFEGDAFDMVFSGDPQLGSDSRQVFATMAEFLTKIK